MWGLISWPEPKSRVGRWAIQKPQSNHKLYQFYIQNISWSNTLSSLSFAGPSHPISHLDPYNSHLSSRSFCCHSGLSPTSTVYFLHSSVNALHKEQVSDVTLYSQPSSGVHHTLNGAPSLPGPRRPTWTGFHLPLDLTLFGLVTPVISGSSVPSQFHPP